MERKTAKERERNRKTTHEKRKKEEKRELSSKVSQILRVVKAQQPKGKALGIVQLVNKGEGLEAWRQLKLEYEGKSGNGLRC